MEKKFISVVVPYYNDKRIDRCLRSLINQRYPKDCYEVILVDNNSTKQYYHKDLYKNVSVVSQPERGSYKSRNLGIKTARGEIIAFTDSDCTIDMDWLDAINLNMAETSEICAVQGLSLSNRWNDVSKAINEMYEKIFFGEIVDAKENYCSRLDTRNCAVFKKCFENVGMFNEKLLYWGDAELGKRIVEYGKKIKYVPEMNIVHSDISELEQLAKKREKEGRIVTDTLFSLGADYTKKYFPEMLFIFLGRRNSGAVMQEKIETMKRDAEMALISNKNDIKSVAKELSNTAFLMGVYQAIENEWLA